MKQKYFYTLLVLLLLTLKTWILLPTLAFSIFKFSSPHIQALIIYQPFTTEQFNTYTRSTSTQWTSNKSPSYEGMKTFEIHVPQSTQKMIVVHSLQTTLAERVQYAFLPCGESLKEASQIHSQQACQQRKVKHGWTYLWSVIHNWYNIVSLQLVCIAG